MKTRALKRLLTILVGTALGVTTIAGTAFADRTQPGHRASGIAAAWAAAWNGSNPQALAKLFAPGSAYTDFAANKVSVGGPGSPPGSRAPTS